MALFRKGAGPQSGTGRAVLASNSAMPGSCPLPSDYDTGVPRRHQPAQGGASRPRRAGRHGPEGPQGTPERHGGRVPLVTAGA